MVSSPFIVALLWAIPLSMFAGLLLIATGIRARNWLEHETGDQMKFVKPRVLRAGAVALGLCFGCISVLTLFIEDFTPHRHPWLEGDHIMNLLQTAVWAFVAVHCLSLSGPSDLSLDASRRAYSWRWGAPWLPHVRTGTWNDLSGIYVQRFKGAKTGEGFTVGIKWKQGLRSCCLGKFDARPEAEEFATQIASKLHLARVESPPIPQLRDIFRS